MKSTRSAGSAPTTNKPRQPNQGKTIDVEVDTHLSGTIEFANGAIATLIASFDVWDSELPRLELYGTKGTLCIRDIDPLDGPNLFGGPVLLRTVDNYRWKGLPRQTPYPEWTEVPNERRFNETSHRENSRGIGLVDLAYAIRDRRPERASGAMALHCLELMEGLLASASEGRFSSLAANASLACSISPSFLERRAWMSAAVNATLPPQASRS